MNDYDKWGNTLRGKDGCILVCVFVCVDQRRAWIVAERVWM